VASNDLVIAEGNEPRVQQARALVLPGNLLEGVEIDQFRGVKALRKPRGRREAGEQVSAASAHGGGLGGHQAGGGVGGGGGRRKCERNGPRGGRSAWAHR
jgi:hypothetical protein